jgi:hypothetical protein
VNSLLTTPDFNSRGSWFLKLSFPFLYLLDLKKYGFYVVLRLSDPRKYQISTINLIKVGLFDTPLFR